MKNIKKQKSGSINKEP